MAAFVPAIPTPIPTTASFTNRQSLASARRIRRATRAIPSASLHELPRRDLLKLCAATLAAQLVVPTSPARAAPPLTSTEASESYGYSFKVPASGWTRNTASLSSFREVTVYLCEEDGDTNVNMVATPVPGDFQKLTSFGTMDNVLDTLVPKGRKGIDGQVISTRVDSSKNAYVIEYTITSAGVARHLITVFSLQPGRYLLTLTGQAKEENWAKNEAVLKSIADSFVLNKFDA